MNALCMRCRDKDPQVRLAAWHLLVQLPASALHNLLPDTQEWLTLLDIGLEAEGAGGPGLASRPANGKSLANTTAAGQGHMKGSAGGEAGPRGKAPVGSAARLAVGACTRISRGIQESAEVLLKQFIFPMGRPNALQPKQDKAAAREYGMEGQPCDGGAEQKVQHAQEGNTCTPWAAGCRGAVLNTSRSNAGRQLGGPEQAEGSDAQITPLWLERIEIVRVHCRSLRGNPSLRANYEAALQQLVDTDLLLQALSVYL